MKRIKLTIEEWNSLKNEEGITDIPVWFKVTGNSMYPFIRANRDDIMIVSVRQEDLKTGDIVLFPGKYKGGDYCLHRLYKIDGDMVQTFGDGNSRPDAWFPRSNILGKAVLIKRGNTTIDCESPEWAGVFKTWNFFWRIRPVMLFPFRVTGKCKRIFDKAVKKNDRNI